MGSSFELKAFKRSASPLENELCRWSSRKIPFRLKTKSWAQGAVAESGDASEMVQEIQEVHEKVQDSWMKIQEKARTHGLCELASWKDDELDESEPQDFGWSSVKKRLSDLLLHRIVGLWKERQIAINFTGQNVLAKSV